MRLPLLACLVAACACGDPDRSGGATANAGGVTAESGRAGVTGRVDPADGIGGAQGAGTSTGTTAGPAGPTPVFGYRVVAEFPHDRRAFTQGLVFAGGQLYESTGRLGASSLRRVDLATGEVLDQRRLASNYFAEGLAAVDDRLIQLTWQAGRAFVYDRATFEKIGEHRYGQARGDYHEGWGLTYDGERLILSDGTHRLRFFDPATFAPLGVVAVSDRGVPVMRLNELEYIRGEVWANVWQSDRIARIDPETGRVKAWVDLAGIIDLDPVLTLGEPQNVLNGIAFEPETERLFVTGKYWPTLFQIEVVE